MKLHEDHIFKDSITATAQHLHISELIVEKDYWVTYALKNIIKHRIVENVVFKGGTSLSKAFNIIKRFSEDVDLAAINLNGTTNSQIRKEIRNLSKKVSADLPEVDDERTTKGDYIRRTFHSYPIRSVVEDNSPIERTVLLEINSITSNLEYQKFPISTFIHAFLKTNNNNDLIKKYEMEPFELNVLDKKRTFTEKILALARYSNDNDTSKIKSKIRHFYDLTMLLKETEIKTFLDSEEFLDTIRIVRENDNATPVFGQPWLKNKIKNSKLMKNPTEIWQDLKGTYISNQLTSLVFDDAPNENEVLETLIKISERIRHLEG